jgi:hypothetical protein
MSLPHSMCSRAPWCDGSQALLTFNVLMLVLLLVIFFAPASEKLDRSVAFRKPVICSVLLGISMVFAGIFLDSLSPHVSAELFFVDLGAHILLFVVMILLLLEVRI